MISGYWPDDYLKKKTTPQKAISYLSPGQRVFIGTSCGEPQALIRTLAKEYKRISDLEIVRLMSLESLPLSFKAVESDCQSFSVRSFYLGSAQAQELAQNKRFIVPIHLSSIPKLFLSRKLPVHAALVQVGPPDDFGWMCLGISVDVTLAAVQSADLVIAQVNPRMPRVLGRSFIHVNEVDIIVEHEEGLLTIEQPPESEIDSIIGKHVAKLIDDGSTLQLSLGTTHASVMGALSGKNDLGIHTQYLSEEIMHLVSMGVINNRKKEINEGKCVASGAIGTNNLYEFVDDNPGIAFYPSDYVNNPLIIAQLSGIVAINVALAIDLSGQAAVDASLFNHYTGVTGTMDFILGARLSQKGKSILILPSTSPEGRQSNIMPEMGQTAVVVPRGDLHYVATEYGVVNLLGKTLEERAMALISIAHPDFREELLDKARINGLLPSTHRPTEAIHGIYPLHLEEIRYYNKEKVLFRPVKPMDARLIQEHFYNLDRSDVEERFLHGKKRFDRCEVSNMYEVDYVNNLTMVAVTGELGYERVIAIGGYYLEKNSQWAEVAFSVVKDWQKKGISSVIQDKLYQAAREKGLAGFIGYLSPDNIGMIKLFHKLPLKITTFVEGQMLVLKAKFDEPY